MQHVMLQTDTLLLLSRIWTKYQKTVKFDLVEFEAFDFMATDSRVGFSWCALARQKFLCRALQATIWWQQQQIRMWQQDCVFDLTVEVLGCLTQASHESNWLK